MARVVGIVLMSWGQFHAEFHRQVRKASYNKLKHMSKSVSDARKARYPEFHGRTVELVERGFTDEEFARFMSHVRDEEARCAFLLMATLGLRVGELLALRPSDIQGDCLYVRALKGSYSAYIKLPKGILACLKGRCNGSDRLYPMLRKTLQSRFAEARKAAGLDEVYMLTKPCGPQATKNRRYRLSIHSLRHYAIQRFYHMTNNPDLTRAFARHRSIMSTQIYMKKDLRDYMAQAIEKMVPEISEKPMEVLA